MKYEIESCGKFTMLHIIGNIDTTESVKILDREIINGVENGSVHYVINLERTTFLDSGGISFFIHSLCTVRDNQGSLFIIAVENQVKRTLDIVGITRLIQVYSTEEEFRLAQGVL